AVHRERLLEIAAGRRGGGLLGGADDQAAGGAHVAGARGADGDALLAEHRAEARDVDPAELRPEEHAVGQPGGPPRRALALSAHLQWRVWRLKRREAEAPAFDACIAALEGDRLATPQRFHELERLLELGH